MATPADVIAAFARMRDGSGLARARGAADVWRSFSSLSATEKRDLAVLVAERAAPHLVPRIQAESGLDLTVEQVRAVVDMAGRLDADDLDQLARAVGATPREPTTTVEEPAVADQPATTDEPAAVVEPDAAVEPAEDEDDVDVPDEVHAGDEDEEDEEVIEPVAVIAEPPPPRTPPAPPRPAASPDALVGRLRDAASNAERLRILRTHADDLLALDHAGRAAVVEAVPDGWARRRAIEGLLRDDVLAAAEVPSLVARLGSPVARAWACATAIEADMLRLEQVDDVVDERAAARLHRRYG